MTNNKNNENVRHEIAEIEARFQSDVAAQEVALSGQDSSDKPNKNKYIIIAIISIILIGIPIMFLFNDMGKSLFNPKPSPSKTDISSGYFIPNQFIGDEIKSEGKIQISEQIDDKTLRYKYSLYDLDGKLISYLESKSLDLSLSESLYVEVSGLLSDQYNGVNVIRVESITYR